MSDRVEVTETGISFIGEKAVNIVRLQTLARGLRMEIMGMRLTRKAPTCYSIIKREFGLKGNKQKVLDQFIPLVEEATAQIPVIER